MVIEGRPVLCASSIVKLSPKLVNGVLTVPRRNNKAEQPWKAKHLITLYHQHDVIRPTVISCHRKLIHVGAEHNTIIQYNVFIDNSPLGLFVTIT